MSRLVVTISCLLTVTLHIVDVRLTCLINITYLLTYLLTCDQLIRVTTVTHTENPGSYWREYLNIRRINPIPHW